MLVGGQVQNSGSLYQLIFLADDIWNIHVVGGWAEFFKLLASEDIDGNQMHLCVTVFASLRGGHIDDLAWTVLDANKAILSQGRALHGIGIRCASICGGIKRMLMLERYSCQLCSLYMCTTIDWEP